MEKGLLKYTQDMLKMSDVAGILVSDSNGLCILASGLASADSSGPAKALYDQCSPLGDDKEIYPTVVFETEGKKILITTNDGIMTSFYKNNF